MAHSSHMGANRGARLASRPTMVTFAGLALRMRAQAGTKRPWLRVRSYLTGLRRLSLLLGSSKDGFLQHDIVRDFAASRCEDERQLQRDVVDAILASRPDGEFGWVDNAARNTAEWYVSTHVRVHIRGAFSQTQEAAPGAAEVLSEEEASLLQRVLAADQTVALACTLALGEDRLLSLAKAAEQGGQPLQAALALYAASLPGRKNLLSNVRECELLRRAEAILRNKVTAAADRAVADPIEADVTMRLINRGGMTNTADTESAFARHAALTKRMNAGKEEGFVHWTNELTRGVFMRCFAKLGFMQGRMDLARVTGEEYAAAAAGFVAGFEGPATKIYSLQSPEAEVVVGRLFLYSMLSFPFICSGLPAAVFGTSFFTDGGGPAGVLRDVGGRFSGVRQVWRQYDYRTHHQLSLRAAGGEDGFVMGFTILLGLLSGGHVAEACEFFKKLGGVLDLIHEDNGGGRTSFKSFSSLRCSLYGAIWGHFAAFSHACGLETQTLAFWRAVGFGQFESEAQRQYSEYYGGIKMYADMTGPTDMALALFNLRTMLFVPTAPNWTAARVERLRAALHGTASGWTSGGMGEGCGKGGVEEHGMLAACCRDVKLNMQACLPPAAKLAERLGLREGGEGMRGRNAGEGVEQGAGLEDAGAEGGLLPFVAALGGRRVHWAGARAAASVLHPRGLAEDERAVAPVPPPQATTRWRSSTLGSIWPWTRSGSEAPA